jgi:hypothetical protein
MFDIWWGFADITNRSFCDMFEVTANVLGMHYALRCSGTVEENNETKI